MRLSKKTILTKLAFEIVDKTEIKKGYKMKNKKTNLPKYDAKKYNSWSVYYIELSNKIWNS